MSFPVFHRIYILALWCLKSMATFTWPKLQDVPRRNFRKRLPNINARWEKTMKCGLIILNDSRNFSQCSYLRALFLEKHET